MTNQTPLDEISELLPNCLRQDRLRLQDKLSRWVHDGRIHQSAAAVEPLIQEARRSIELRHRRHEKLPQVSYPENLPITARKDDIVAAIRAHQVVVIAGETGSGKTTQIPKMCLEAGCGVEGKIGCTQPRRVAALSISRRIAEELNVGWGQEVGCKIRFSDRSSPITYIKLMTDGILLAETQADRDLYEYDAIVIDEAHERSLNIDFLLGHLKLLLSRRPDLKVIITSATIDTEAFSKAFGDAPVLEVSGRTFPVEIRYQPHDPEAEERGDLTYIDAAVSAVETVLLESDRGDVLVFMPSERDIRETQDDLQGRYGSEAEVVPLFGRLSSGEQDRVFAPSVRRKLIVATNIAETSLTIPGVRYVIDTGLARVSRYSPRTRTKRLPIEPVSQSSARQRAGRSGRVENGVCIRLYSEEDFEARPKDSQPEIQRANLAEVILKMKAWRLGEMETFPFLNPPQPQAIQSGYQLLEELGALGPDRELTRLGRDLARLPVDPSIGRMILQSAQEGALDEVLIISAGLSIQDPRERPLDRQDAADQAHRQFLDPRSDFLTLLNIWNSYDAQFEALRTQNQMRRFCRTNFLSYTRMREWIDVHTQLRDAVRGMRALDHPSVSHPEKRAPGDPHRSPSIPPGRAPQETPQSESNGRRPREKPSAVDPVFEAIHRSILTGLLGHVAQRTERNLYRAPGNQQVMLWPGSSLFDRLGKAEKSRGGPSPSGQAAVKTHQPEWIMAGEVVETSRLYGRTVAGVNSDWIVELGAHICKRSYGEPFWDERTGRVLARERITIFGLEVQERAIDYGRVNADQATTLFIRAALVDETSELPQRFVEHNRKLRQKLAVWRTRHRDHRLPNPDDALFDFYARQIQGVSSVHDLNRLLKEKGRSDPDFLCATEADLTGGSAIAWDTAAFPNEIAVADQSANVEYAYAPGQEHDGITVKLPVALAHRVDPHTLDLAIPGLRVEQIEFLLRALPKPLRVPLMPLAPKVSELAGLLPADAGLEGLRRLIEEKYGVALPANTWRPEALPDHLRPRIAITGAKEKVLAAGRDLQQLKIGLEKHETPAEQAAWARAVQQWERYDLRSWTFGDVPERIDVTEISGSLLAAFPGLEHDGGAVHLKLFRKREEAEAATQKGLVQLIELALQKELAWVQKDLRALEKLQALYASFTTPEQLLTDAHINIRRSVIQPPVPLLPLRQTAFESARDQARTQIPGAVPKLVELVRAILALRSDIVQHRGFPAPAAPARKPLAKDLSQLGAPQPRLIQPALTFLPVELERLLPPQFLAHVSLERLPHWPRYLKALIVRADRALLNSAKDAEKARQVQPYVDALYRVAQRPGTPRSALAEYRWLVEEFKVSVFAQELGTATSISARRLDTYLSALESGQ